MKTIGLIGGLSWESSIEYYRIINQTMRRRAGGLHSARSVMVSLDFEEIEQLQHAGDWEAATELMVTAGRQVQAGGADFVAICSNTMHKMAPALEAALEIPLLHIADATAQVIQSAGMHRIGLLGTAFTMEQDFYKGRLEASHGLAVLVPEAAQRQPVHRIIYEELCQGVVRDESRQTYLNIMQSLDDKGVQGIILGCTEIGLLIKPEHTEIRLFDTTVIHAEQCVAMAMGD